MLFLFIFFFGACVCLYVCGDCQKELRHDSSRGGVAIVTDKTNPVTSTSLLLRQVRLSDSGKYSCTPSNADPASVTLHVLQGLSKVFWIYLFYTSSPPPTHHVSNRTRQFYRAKDERMKRALSVFFDNTKREQEQRQDLSI